MRALTLLALIVTLAFSTAACQGKPMLGQQACPASLLEGTLVEDGGALAVQTTSGGSQVVHWPDGVHVGYVDGQLTVVGFFGQVIAREGDWVHMGGGYAPGDEFFAACGEIEVTPRGS